MDINAFSFLPQFLMQFLPLLFALCVHEWAHGYMALKLGDNTAQLMGRLTVNPAPHIDVLGTLVFPAIGLLGGGFLFGWAKPVPVNPRNLKDPRRDMFWVAAAGPLSNFVQALVGTGLLILVQFFFRTGSTYDFAVNILSIYVSINMILGCFNLIPLHPLDGGKVLARFLSPRASQWMDDNETMLSAALIVLLLTGVLSLLLWPAHFVSRSLIGFAMSFGGY